MRDRVDQVVYRWDETRLDCRRECRREDALRDILGGDGSENRGAAGQADVEVDDWHFCCETQWWSTVTRLR